MPAATAFDQLLHHVAHLVALDRKHPLVAAAVAVLGDRPLKSGVQAFETVLEDVVKADQQWQAQAPALQLTHQFDQIECPTPLALGLHHHMPPLAHGEVGLSPAVETIEGGTVGGGPAVAAGKGHHRVSRWG